MKNTLRTIQSIDWILMLSVLMLVFFGLTTMKSFGGSGDTSAQYFFTRQTIWLVVSLLVFSTALFIDWSFFKTNSIFLILLYASILAMLVVLLIGSRSI